MRPPHCCVAGLVCAAPVSSTLLPFHHLTTLFFAFNLGLMAMCLELGVELCSCLVYNVLFNSPNTPGLVPEIHGEPLAKSSPAPNLLMCHWH